MAAALDQQLEDEIRVDQNFSQNGCVTTVVINCHGEVRLKEETKKHLDTQPGLWTGNTGIIFCPLSDDLARLSLMAKGPACGTC